MNLLSVENISKSFGDRLIFEDISFGISQGQKVAIVAKNGAGKTTLLRCIMQHLPIEAGEIVFRKDCKVAFMEQNEDLNAEHTVIEEILSHPIPELQAVKEYNLATEKKDEIAIQRAVDKLSELNAWEIETQVKLLLSVLKIDQPKEQIKNLSGGQKKRIALLKVLIAQADFLILDEPTNHLDLDMIEWLEEYLSKSQATILMVTHDRYFLEVVCDTILELDEQKLYRYKGNFSYFLEKKALRHEQQQATIEKAKNLFRKELDWMRRQPKARGTKQKARIDSFFETKQKANQKIDTDEIEIPVKMERLGTKIIELHHVSKAFTNKIILDNFSYVFKRQERLGIVGNNGTGKSTFLNLILNIEPADKGKIVTGETIIFGYYNQEQLVCPEDKRVIDVIRDVAEYIPLEKGRQLSAAHFLEKFLFPRSMHYNFVRKLSGGEKRRLKLMTVLMKNPNFLILDEPTNDLDIFAMSVLEDYLRTFQGCLLVVSHDRYFMDKMVDHLFVFSGQGNIKDITGNYTQYRQQQKQIVRQEKEKITSENLKKTAEKNLPIVKVEKQKLSYKEQKEYESLEHEIQQLEQKQQELTLQLSLSTLSSEQMMKAGEALAQVVHDLELKTNRWIELDG